MTHTPHHEPVLWCGPYLVALMNAEQLTAYDMGKDAGIAERRLWGATLALLVDDARRYWQNRRHDTEAEQAFDDLVRCGPMTRHVCRWLDTDAQWISRGFISWCESNMA
ncbi:hypothetical protein [Marinobacter sp.]|uniref:hypothetical protein n=1 Tax=Marinobacter sp. TaxID=50741 RepID=UPI003A94D407